jgi:hypothetical protein
MKKRKKPRKTRPNRQKSAVFSTRMEPDLRQHIEQSAKRHSGGNVSKEVSRLMWMALANQEKQEPYLRALAYLISNVASGVGSGWKSDPWRFKAFKAGVVTLLDKLTPYGEVVVPESVPPLLRTPESFGEVVAMVLFGQLRDLTEPSLEQSRALSIPSNSWVYALPQARRDLGVAFSARLANLLLQKGETK